MLEAGKLDRRVSIESPSTYQDDTGQELARWSPVATVWAAWRRASARETLAAAEVSATVTDVFEIRWSNLVAAVDPKHRLIFEDRTYDIAEVTMIGRREGLRISASTRGEL
jgi:SPP1 family predicted phage head-tail adaptor